MKLKPIHFFIDWFFQLHHLISFNLFEKKEDRKSINLPPLIQSPNAWNSRKWADQNQEPLSLGLPHNWQWLSYLNHDLLACSMCIRRKLESEAEPRPEPRHSIWDADMPRSILITVSSTYPKPVSSHVNSAKVVFRLISQTPVTHPSIFSLLL